MLSHRSRFQALGRRVAGIADSVSVDQLCGEACVRQHRLSITPCPKRHSCSVAGLGVHSVAPDVPFQIALDFVFIVVLKWKNST